MKKVLGPAVEEMGGMVADYVRIHRLGKQIKAFTRSQQMLTDAGLTPSPIAMKTLWPLMEGISIEDNDSLSEKWAALLANAASPNGSEVVEPSFADVLKQLTPTQALILDHLYEQVDGRLMQQERGWYYTFKVDKVRRVIELPFTDFERCMDNLIRLRLCTRIIPARNNSLFKPPAGFPTTEPTMFGYAFVQACKAPIAQKL
ncbi:Abi-alpha family protein [Hymenobacter sediminicola]|uniref:DUF4393 domain-containing protein n=1 Tax=Hymenobacter sediminicola TaxID=2761579 RepID=A0A7G7W769_9BACT|nr:Abi-alpha family protein [Hymenobacter sediminicola]QNH62212.1 DUF4393 domain-containing protein [Hymenobacter sediminicola]